MSWPFWRVKVRFSQLVIFMAIDGRFNKLPKRNYLLVLQFMSYTIFEIIGPMAY